MDQMNSDLYGNDRKMLKERLFKSLKDLDPRNPLSDAESDDEHIRRSWTTEKQADISREIKETVQDAVNNQTQEKELIGSYGSFDWSTGNTSFDKEKEEEEGMEYSNQQDHEEHEEHDIDKVLLEKVDAALHILNDEMEEENLLKSSEWKLNYTEDGKPFYVDSNAWQVDGSTDEKPEQSLEESFEKTEVNQESEPSTTPSTDEVQEDNNDEWREAYTAKGRVYYYNRRTRESSWKKPSSFIHVAATDNNISTHADGTTISSPSKDNNVEKEEKEEEEVEEEVDSVKSQHQTIDIKNQDHLFCIFCGIKCFPRDMKTHLNEVCTSAIHHQTKSTSLFKQFEEMLLFLSEQPALRSLHYATSTPVIVSNRLVVSHSNENNQETLFPASSVSPDVRQGSASIQASLSLLRQHGNTNKKNNGKQTHHRHHHVLRSSSSSQTKRDTISSRYQSAITNRKTSVSMTMTLPSNHNNNTSNSNSSTIDGPIMLSQMEECRHCHRRFAEGRVAKHETVCPRVFGSGGANSRGRVSSSETFFNQTNLSLSQQHQLIARQLQQQRRRSSVPMYLKKKPLVMSFKEYQATLVPCPCCHRKFHPSGVKQHVDICQTVQNRPRSTKKYPSLDP